MSIKRDQTDWDAIRWIEVVNQASESIPPYGLMAITGISDDGYFQVNQPTSNGQMGLLANGPFEIIAGGYGSGHNSYPAAVAYDQNGGTPTVGSTWGAAANSWYLTKGQSGYTLLGGVANGLANVAPSFSPNYATILVTSDAPVSVNGYQHYKGYIQAFDDEAGTWQNSGSEIWVVPASGANLMPGMYPVAIGIGSYQGTPVYTVASSLLTGIVRLSSTTASGTTTAGYDYYPGYFQMLSIAGGIVDGPAVNVVGHYNSPTSFAKSTSVAYLAFCLPAPYDSAGYSQNGLYGGAGHGPFWYAFAPYGLECLSTDAGTGDTAATITNVTSIAVDQGSGLNLTPSGTSDSVQAVISAQAASATHNGVVNTTAQTLAGDKTFTGNVTVNESVTIDSSLTVDFLATINLVSFDRQTVTFEPGGGSQSGSKTVFDNSQFVTSGVGISRGRSFFTIQYSDYQALDHYTGQLYLGVFTWADLADRITSPGSTYFVWDGIISAGKGFSVGTDTVGASGTVTAGGHTLTFTGGILTSFV